MTLGLWLLRVKQLGLSLTELDELDAGDVADMLIEQGNDKEQYPYRATQEDIDRFFG